MAQFGGNPHYFLSLTLAFNCQALVPASPFGQRTMQDAVGERVTPRSTAREARVRSRGIELTLYLQAIYLHQYLAV